MSENDPTIQTYATYTEARAAMERILDHDVPASAVSISARGIRLVEEVHPKGWLYAASEGGLNGALIGLLVGFLLGLFDLSAPGFSAVVLGFWGAGLGAVAGIVVSLVVHGLRGEGDRHTTERSMRAEHYDLRVAREHLDDARRILARVDTGSPAAA